MAYLWVKIESVGYFIYIAMLNIKIYRANEENTKMKKCIDSLHFC